MGAQFAACALQPYEGFGAFNIQGETIPITSFLNIIKEQATVLGMGEYVSLSVTEGAPPNLFVCDLDHSKIAGTFKNLPLTEIAEGVRKSLIEFRAMAEKGNLKYSTASS